MNSFLESARKQFLYYKKLGEQSIQQLSDDELNWQYNSETNSVATIVRHISGNMLSRFTDFLTSDGEKSWRNRDDEFEKAALSREHILGIWEKGWNAVLTTIEALSETDLEKIVYIRNEGHTATEAINRQLAHYPYHVGQIVFIAKMLKADQWQSLSIAKNKSEEFNQQKFSKDKGKRHFTDDL